MKTINTAIMALALIVMQSCVMINRQGLKAEGEDVTYDYKLDGFEGIMASSAIEMVYTPLDVYSVSVTLPESLAEHLVVKVRDNELVCYIDTKSGLDLNGRKIVAKVSAPGITSFSATGAASIECMAPIVASTEVEVEATSASSIHLQCVQAPKIDVESSSAASVVIATATGNLDAEASSAAKMEIAGIFGKCEVEASSASSVKVAGTATEIEIDGSSAARIDLSGLECSGGTLKASSGSRVAISNSISSSCTWGATSGGSISK